jgi:hypothetical protein
LNSAPGLKVRIGVAIKAEIRAVGFTVTAMRDFETLRSEALQNFEYRSASRQRLKHELLSGELFADTIAYWVALGLLILPRIVALEGGFHASLRGTQIKVIRVPHAL